MIANNNLTSLLIPSQLPEHIRDDPSYANFVTFIQAYYEWMEQDGNVTDRSKNLLNYTDIDSSIDDFLNYFYNDFLSYFPENILADKNQVVKLAKELYKSKGTQASYQLLFRILYNLDVDFFYTKDAVLKASDGKWYVSKSVMLSTDLMYISDLTYETDEWGNIFVTVTTPTAHGLQYWYEEFTISGIVGINAPNGTYRLENPISKNQFIYWYDKIDADPSGPMDISNASIYIPSGFANENFLKTNNLRIFGESTKSIATIENSVIAGKRVEVFISNIERLFNSGEYVRVVDSNNQDVLFDGYPLRAKILGQISQINIDPKHRGNLYEVDDPIIIYDGLNTPTGHGAKATVSEVTKGSIQRIHVVDGGYGYTQFNNDPFPEASGFPGYDYANSSIRITNAPGAQAHIASLNTSPSLVANVSFIATNDIGGKHTIQIGAAEYEFAANINANITSTLANAFSFVTFSTYPISSVIVDNGGGGISQTPVVTADSLYFDELGVTSGNLANLKNLGILAPIKIITGGTGYVENDIIQIIGGTGWGANAKVSSVNASGSILTTEYESINNMTPGGMGYKINDLYPTQNTANSLVLSALQASNDYKLSSGLPLLNVTSDLGQDAVLIVPGILGHGATFNPVTDRVGNITKIDISDYGEDYISAPKVSFKIQDIAVNGILGLQTEMQPQKGDIVYQGENLQSSSYHSVVESVELLVQNDMGSQAIYKLRVFNYNKNPDENLDIIVDTKDITMRQVHLSDDDIKGLTHNQAFYKYKVDGVLNYGDGTAKGTAKFLNGLTIGQGEYLDSTGQPSAFSVLQSSEYNNFTYKLTLEKEISKYRKTLLDLIHPTGMKVIGRYALKSEASTNFSVIDVVYSGNTLSHFTGSHNSELSIVADFINQSNNIIKFNNLYGAELLNFMTTDSIIKILSNNGDCISGEVIEINNSANTITIKDNVWLTFANVANITAAASSNIIHISSLTDSYDIINNGEYSNTAYPLKDIVKVGDNILVANNTSRTVSNINYEDSIIYLSTNLTSAANSLMSVNRLFEATSENIKIFGPVGQQYYPELTTEDGRSLISEDGSLILLG
jgi:hypothetical protein